eukprot:1052755-Alexandrium_andersonii.AAC.1
MPPTLGSDQNAIHALAMIGLRFVQEQMAKEAAGGSPDPALLAMIRGATVNAPAAAPAGSA